MDTEIHLKGKTFNTKRFHESIGYTPHKGQAEMHFNTSRFRIMTCGVRWGKSLSAAVEALAYAIKSPRQRIWIVAPTYDLTEKVYREFRALLINHYRDYILKENRSTKYTQLLNGTELWCKSADNPISLSGEALDFLIVDECPGVKEEIWTHYLRERLTDRKGKALFIGTPKGRNWYYFLFMKGQDPQESEYWSKQAPTVDNPHIEPEEIEDAKKQIPQRAFQQEYLAEFISDAGGVFRHVRDCIGGQLMKPLPNMQYMMGVDLAKYQDYTVICVLDQNQHLVYFDRFHRIDWSLQKIRIAQTARNYNNARVIIDSTGVGDPIYEDLTKPPFSLNLRPFKITGQSKKPLIDNLAIRIENIELSFPDVPELINELEIYEYETTTSGNLRFNAPQGFHDDCVIALALAVSESSTKWAIGELSF